MILCTPHSLASSTPAGPTENDASDSAIDGESITLQTRVSARPLRKWRRVVDAWAMMFPPIGAICGPKDIASGFATTWLVITHATPYL